MGNSQTFMLLLLVNLALNGTATQSSTYSSQYNALRAIDGNNASRMLDYSCTHTNFQNNPWWRVDLLAVYDIGTVIITNRGDCCSERIGGAELRIGNSLDNNGNNNPRCLILPNIAAGATESFTCNMDGRYVNILVLGANQVASLCEVQVYGAPVKIFRRTFVKLKFNSSVDLNNPTRRNNALQKIESAIVQRSVLQVRWTKKPKLERGT